MTTLKEIAATAQVSITTVSDVLNNKSAARRVSAATAKRVLAAATQCGYRPNVHARALVQKRTFLAGLVASSLHTSFFGNIVAGYLEKMEEAGFCILLSYARDSAEVATAAFSEMVRRGAEGAAFIGCSALFRATPRIPVAATHLAAVRHKVSCVTVDHTLGGRLAAEHLLDLGRRRTALVGQDIDGRLAAAETVLTAGGASVMCCTPAQLPAHVQRGINGAFCATDFQAASALGELLRAGLAVPGDCALIGYDDLRLAAIVCPALTTIRQPKEIYGHTLAELLLERLNGGPARSVLLAPELVVRESTLPRR